MAEKSLLVGDEAADLLLSYAALVAQLGAGDQVTLHAVGADGDEVSVGFLLNSGTVLLIETSTGSALDEPDNHEAVEYMRARIDGYSESGDESSLFNTSRTEAWRVGSITYDGWTVEFEDRLLAHLHLVIFQQLRKQHSFVMSWVNSVESGDGRGSIWIHPGGDLAFRFTGSKVPTFNQEWLSRLVTSAESSQGLIVTNEEGHLARSQAIKRS